MTAIIRNTINTYVEEEQWMYAAEVGIVVQALPIEVIYWEEIRNNNWLTLNLWSSISTNKREQTINTLHQILKSNTSHIAYARSHFFNLGEIGANRYKNMLIEILHAIVITHDQGKESARRTKCSREVIQDVEIEEGCLATQKRGAHWFMSISKKKARELARRIPTQIKEALLQSNSAIQINSLAKNINWSTVNGDGYCGYQALHAVEMYSEGKTYIEIIQNIKTSENPYKLLAFLQRQIPKLKDQNMANALRRTTLAMKALKGYGKISQDSWCPTEMIDQILPTLQPSSNSWHHTRPPTGSPEWITTYYKKEWPIYLPSLDVIYNGLDHYTIHLNVGIRVSEISEGIDNLVDMITQRDNMKIGWNKIKGRKIPKAQLNNEITWLADDNEIAHAGVSNKRTCRTPQSQPNSPSHGYAVTECDELKHQPHNTTPDKSTTWLRAKTPINYASQYNQLDDSPPVGSVLDIPFPKDQQRDSTARKDLVFAPSRIGDGLGVYTLGNIPTGTRIMEYIDESMEVILKEDVCGNNRDTTYMYANHKTNTYINASNNKHSYCGLVNEALEDRHFNTIICESRDNDGKKVVYYKSRRNIIAKEELGTRYSIDGSYWDTSKEYTDEFLEKVRKCYDRTIPFQNNNSKANEVTLAFKNLTTHADEHPHKRNLIYNSDESSDEENDITLKEKWMDYDRKPVGPMHAYDTYRENHVVASGDDEYESEPEKYPDRELYTNTIHDNEVHDEINNDGTYSFYSETMHNTAMNSLINNDQDPTNKRKRQQAQEDEKPKRTRFKQRNKSKRGKERRAGKNKRKLIEIKDIEHDMSMKELHEYSKQMLVEYILKQQGRQKESTDAVIPISPNRALTGYEVSSITSEFKGSHSNQTP